MTIVAFFEKYTELIAIVGGGAIAMAIIRSIDDGQLSLSSVIIFGVITFRAGQAVERLRHRQP